MLAPSAMPLSRVRGSFPFLAQCITEVEAFEMQRTSEAWLAKGGQSLEYLSLVLPSRTKAVALSRVLCMVQTGRECCGKEALPVGIELWDRGAPH